MQVLSELEMAEVSGGDTATVTVVRPARQRERVVFISECRLLIKSNKTMEEEIKTNVSPKIKFRGKPFVLLTILGWLTYPVIIAMDVWQGKTISLNVLANWIFMCLPVPISLPLLIPPIFSDSYPS